MPAAFYHLLADVVLLTHTAYIAFVLTGLLLIILGGLADWKWIRNPWFRSLHLAAIGLVAVQSWLGLTCPLTTLEMNLRARAGDTAYSGAFIAHWLQQLIFYEAPGWVFTVAYTGFALLVAGSWLWLPPRPFPK